MDGVMKLIDATKSNVVLRVLKIHESDFDATEEMANLTFLFHYCKTLQKLVINNSTYTMVKDISMSA